MKAQFQNNVVKNSLKYGRNWTIKGDPKEGKRDGNFSNGRSSTNFFASSTFDEM